MRESFSRPSSSSGDFFANTIELSPSFASTSATDLSAGEPVLYQWDDDSPISKKRRIERACDACRRKKTRCDGPKMIDNVCTNCIQNRKACTYIEASKPRGPSKAYITGLEDKVEHLEALLEQLYPESDFSHELGPPIIRGSWRDDHPANPANLSRSQRLSSSRSPEVPPPHHRAHASGSHMPFRIYPSQANSPDSESPIALSTHLLSYASGRQAFVPSHERDEADASDESSEAEVEDVSAMSLTSGRIRLTETGLDTMLPRQNPELDSQMRFHGQSSFLDLIGTTRMLRELHLDQSRNENASRIDPESGWPRALETSLRRPEFWSTFDWEMAWEGHNTDPTPLIDSIAQSFPPPDLAHDLFDLYFCHINTLAPLLHRPSFERRWLSGLQHRDPWFACLALCVFAVASKFSSDERVIADSSPIQKDEDREARRWDRAGWQWFLCSVAIHRARTSILHPASLYQIQTLNLIGVFLRCTGELESVAWIIFGVGIRKAQDVGVHRKRVYSKTPSVTQELWKRVFWNLVVHDRNTSMSLGRSCSTVVEDFDLDPLLEVDDEYWEADDPAQAFRQPPGKPSNVAQFNALARGTQISAFALRTTYAIDKSKVHLRSVAPSWKEDITRQLNVAMSDWVDSIPSHLKWSSSLEDPTFTQQSATLMKIHYLTQITVYRTFLYPSTLSPISPRASTPAMSMCVRAASSCARIVATQFERGLLSDVPDLLHTAQVCASILIMRIWELKKEERVQRQLQAITEEDIKPPFATALQALFEDVGVFFRALEWASPRWQHAAHYLSDLQSALPDSEMDSDVTEHSPSSEGLPTEQQTSAVPIARTPRHTQRPTFRDSIPSQLAYGFRQYQDPRHSHPVPTHEDAFPYYSAQYLQPQARPQSYDDPSMTSARQSGHHTIPGQDYSAWQSSGGEVPHAHESVPSGSHSGVLPISLTRRSRPSRLPGVHSDPMMQLDITSARLEGLPESPQSHGSAQSQPGWTSWPVHQPQAQSQPQPQPRPPYFDGAREAISFPAPDDTRRLLQQTSSARDEYDRPPPYYAQRPP